ncbi:ABC transporter ATP-binding protein [Pseudoruegeria sp. SHC-113]|uniref:ABC transporter ATP-binding protein n=1 Tax=Pseudoruegeria sp. SHC-113 TaxID=2855439 RepID=UPI0021BB8E35|nr:ABC transporter ATP-binding protein [Pseudoruegeria sp. SHC-113]
MSPFRLTTRILDRLRLEALIDPLQPADGPPPRTLMAFFGWCLQGSWPVLGLAAFISVVAGVIEVGSAFLLGLVVDGALRAGAGGLAGEWPLLLGVAGFFLILRPLVFGASAAIQSMAVGPNVMPLVLSRLNRYALGHSVEFFDNDFAGRIAQKQMQTSRAVTDVTMEMINVVAFALASLVGAALLLMGIDWRIGAILSVWLVGYLLMIRWFMPRVRVRSGRRASARAMVSGQIVDTITNIKTVKLFAHDAHEDTAANESLSEWRETAVHFGELSTFFRFALMAVAGVVPVILIGATLLLWNAGEVTAGAIAATGAVSLRIAQMTGWVSFVLMAIYANIGEVEDGMTTLTPSHALTDSRHAKPLQVTSGALDFEDVQFNYGQQTGGVNGITLAVQGGEKIGIVGASGAGKSTLVNLLLRLYDPEGGRVEIDGQNIKMVTQESLRAQIGTVTQETAMFNRSAFENIRYGTPGATLEQVQEAARRAEAHDFVLQLRDHKGREGYDAHLGERGVKLSGGQRQRIALARAILKDAPILVLDEATSALDSEVEAAIQAALERVMQGKTVLAIAHRLSTIAQMDRIIVLDEGRIAEQGSHEELLALGGLYARYWERQSGGFLTIQDAAE